MFIPISDSVFVPVHRVERLAFWGDTAHVKYIDARDPDIVKGQDALRLRQAVCGPCVEEDKKKGGRKC